jgi:RNA polymerase sigma-70 factor (ECF subfamily)
LRKYGCFAERILQLPNAPAYDAQGPGVEKKQFSDIFSQYSGRLYSYALWQTRNKESSQDIIQTIFIKLWKYDSLELEGKALESWLFRVTRNACIDFFRKCARNLRLSMQYRLEMPWKTVDTKEQKHVWEALEMLSKKERAILYLNFKAGYTYKEIAKMLGMQESNVRVASFRALEKIRKKYSRKAL